MEALWLVHHGVPFDLAFQLDDLTRCGFAIIFSQFERGQPFDFDRMRFPDSPK